MHIHVFYEAGSSNSQLNCGYLTIA